MLLLGLLTRYHKLGSSSNRNVCLTVLEARRPRSRCQQSWYFLRVKRKSPFHISALTSGGSLAIFSVPQTIKASAPSLHLSLHGVLPVCVCVQISSSRKAIGHVGLGPTLITIFINYICQGPTSKWSQICSYCRVRILTCEFVGDAAQSLAKLCAGQGGDHSLSPSCLMCFPSGLPCWHFEVYSRSTLFLTSTLDLPVPSGGSR